MKKSVVLSLMILSAVLSLTACGNSKKDSSITSESTKSSESVKQTEQTSESQKKESTMKETVDKTMNAMTLEEKVGQLFMARVPEQNQVADIQNYQRASRSEAGDHKLSRGQQNTNVYWVR